MRGTDKAGRVTIDDFRQEALGTVASTNSECLARARAGARGGLWITADRQTGGRGRRGRTWLSAAGNLYASLLLIDPAPLSALASLPLAVAIAVRGAVARVMPPGSAPVEIKWPNDILIGGAKTSGILIEGEPLEDGRHAVVIGIGINVATKPDGTPYPVTCLADEGAAAGRDEVFAHLFASMAESLSLWQGGRGVAEVAAQWRKYARGIGRPINIVLSDRTISGIFAGIDDNGMLILDRGPQGRMTIAAGDVFFE